MTGSIFGRVVVMTALLLVAMPAAARTIAVGPGGSVPTLASVPWRDLAPGDEVVVAGGAVAGGAVVIAARGTAGAPIRIVAAPGRRPSLKASIIFDGAHHVEIAGFDIEGAEHAGIAIQNGSEAIVVRDMILRRNGMGVWIANGAGGSHRIETSEMSENRTHGVGIDRIANPPGKESVIARNRIFRNAMHGVELDGSRFIVEENTVYENGQTQWGTSGIHIYAGGFQGAPRHPGMGSFNVIRYNTVFRNKDVKSYDGNGIQADLWCDDNEIAYNVVFENDGAGIIVFDGARNRIVNNTVYGNQIDPGKSHIPGGEVTLASDHTKPIDNTIDTVVKNNVLVAKTPTSVAISVDRHSARHRHTFGGNVMFNTSGAAVLSFDGRRDSDLAWWRQVAHGAADDIIADPLFSDAANPVDGLRPRAQSPAARAGQVLGHRRDRSGAAVPADRAPSSGAYQIVPVAAK